jgi:GNAT superfamily N-acetyltransferase
MVGVQGNEITKLYVDPRFQRQGIGTMLFEAAQQVVAAAGYEEMVAWVAFDAAIPFYEARGMSAVGRKFDLLGPVEGGNALLAKKRLAVR